MQCGGAQTGEKSGCVGNCGGDQTGRRQKAYMQENLEEIRKSKRLRMSENAEDCTINENENMMSANENECFRDYQTQKMFLLTERRQVKVNRLGRPSKKAYSMTEFELKRAANCFLSKIEEEDIMEREAEKITLDEIENGLECLKIDLIDRKRRENETGIDRRFKKMTLTKRKRTTEMTTNIIDRRLIMPKNRSGKRKHKETGGWFRIKELGGGRVSVAFVNEAQQESSDSDMIVQGNCSSDQTGTDPRDDDDLTRPNSNGNVGRNCGDQTVGMNKYDSHGNSRGAWTGIDGDKI
jgi:hypothetical protein